MFDLFYSDIRYGIMIILFFVLALIFIILRSYKKRKELLLKLLIISPSLAFLQVNLLKKIPQISIYYPVINFYEPMIIIALTFILVYKKIKFPKNTNKFFLIYLLFNIVSLFVSPKIEYGVYKLIIISEMYLGFLAIYNLIDSPNDVKIIFKSFSIICLIELFFIIIQLFSFGYDPIKDFFVSQNLISTSDIFGSRAIIGTFGSAASFAHFIGLIANFLLIFALNPSTSKKINKYIYFSFIISIFIQILTLSRVTNFILIIFFMLIIIFRKKLRLVMQNRPRYLFHFLILIILAFIITSNIFSSSEVVSKRFSKDDLFYSATFRIFPFTIAKRSISSNPFLGCGLGYANNHTTTSQGNIVNFNKFILSSEESYYFGYGVHSGNASIIIETGILGFFVYLIWLINFIKQGIKLYKKSDYGFIRNIGIGSIFVIVYFFLMEFDGVGMTYPFFMFFFSLFLGLTSAVHDKILYNNKHIYENYI